MLGPQTVSTCEIYLLWASLQEHFPIFMTLKSKKRNFTSPEIEILISEIEKTKVSHFKAASAVEIKGAAEDKEGNYDCC